MSSLANSSVGVALVGVGMVSGTYVDAMAKLGDFVHLTGVMGSQPASGTAFIDKYAARLESASKPLPQVYGSIDELLADKSVEFVIVITPPDARQHFVSAIASAGLPILMEKPISLAGTCGDRCA